MTDDEPSLVKRCLAGESASVRHLIGRYESDVFGLCMRVLTHRQDAEDVTQETFVRVFRSLRRWDNTRPLRPWILRIAFNRCRTWISQRARRPELVDYLQETAGKEVPDDAGELAGEIQLSLHKLRPEFRSVFVMFHEQGMSYEEIAEVHERPVGTIKTWLHRTRMEVLDYLRKRGLVPDEMNSNKTVGE
ncbi:RNA polymerase sigma factor [Zavarzinella formosa]|uniref:RNA polymerase sigma factor n=1 Tax=Zavarzinella formosa TaxID=360055 RepID=UPI00030800CB|nr:RNA polymerase sigma factor [Zavarzinella formosa]